MAERGSNVRVAVAALSVSLAAFVGWATHEGYTTNAVIPTKGDVPTLSHGLSPSGTSGAPTDPWRQTPRPPAAAPRSNESCP